MEKIKAVIEALIFASDTPLSPERIRAVFPEVEKTEIREIIDQLVSEYHDRQGEFSCRKLRAFSIPHQSRSQPVDQAAQNRQTAVSVPAGVRDPGHHLYKQPIVKSKLKTYAEWM
jgi:chromosome segregation and condensation protein ScpB